MSYGFAPQSPSGYISQLSHQSRTAGGDDVSRLLVPAKQNSAGTLARQSSLDSLVLKDVHRSIKVTPWNKGAEQTCWCTYCPRQFRTKDGWSRHEKEDHENQVYPCMPHGPVENRGRGPECSICATSNPDEGHLMMHQLGPCLEKSVTGREYKRRGDLVSHLRKHGVPNGLGLAEQWKRTSGRKAWACGFCLNIFFQRMDRINHIFQEHWRNGVTMKSWSPSMVIQGLLLQPQLSNRWLESLSKGSIIDPSRIKWHRSVAEDLQRRLEVLEEPPESLVAAAYEQSSLGQNNDPNRPISKQSVATNSKIHYPWHSFGSAQDLNRNQNIFFLYNRRRYCW